MALRLGRRRVDPAAVQVHGVPREVDGVAEAKAGVDADREERAHFALGGRDDAGELFERELAAGVRAALRALDRAEGIVADSGAGDPRQAVPRLREQRAHVVEGLARRAAADGREIGGGGLGVHVARGAQVRALARGPVEERPDAAGDRPAGGLGPRSVVERTVPRRPDVGEWQSGAAVGLVAQLARLGAEDGSGDGEPGVVGAGAVTDGLTRRVAEAPGRDEAAQHAFRGRAVRLAGRALVPDSGDRPLGVPDASALVEGSAALSVLLFLLHCIPPAAVPDLPQLSAPCRIASNLPRPPRQKQAKSPPNHPHTFNFSGEIGRTCGIVPRIPPHLESPVNTHKTQYSRGFPLCFVSSRFPSFPRVSAPESPPNHPQSVTG